MDIKKKSRAKWAEIALQAIVDAGEKLPCMARNVRGDDKADFRFRYLNRIASMCEVIKDCNGNRFKTSADVYRAAMYIGVHMLYIHTRDESKHSSNLGDFLYHLCQAAEWENTQLIWFDFYTEQIFRMWTAYKKGIQKREKMEKRVNDIIASIPENLQELARHKFEQIKQGEKITNLMECDTWGGKRSNASRIGKSDAT